MPDSIITDLKISNYKDSIQYALGSYIGDFLLKGGFTTIDLDYFMAGLEDRFNKRQGLIKDSIVLPLITAYQTEQQKTRGKAQEKKLFESIKDQPGIHSLPGGILYNIIKSGTGPHPQLTDSVVIQFKGNLADGTLFEDTYTKNLTALTLPETLIPGLKAVLPLMQAGSKWQVFIPAAQGYGEEGSGVIPPNSALIILIELLELRKKN